MPSNEVVAGRSRRGSSQSTSNHRRSSPSNEINSGRGRRGSSTVGSKHRRSSPSNEINSGRGRRGSSSVSSKHRRSSPSNEINSGRGCRGSSSVGSKHNCRSQLVSSTSSHTSSRSGSYDRFVSEDRRSNSVLSERCFSRSRSRSSNRLSSEYHRSRFESFRSERERSRSLSGSVNRFSSEYHQSYEHQSHHVHGSKSRSSRCSIPESGNTLSSNRSVERPLKHVDRQMDSRPVQYVHVPPGEIPLNSVPLKDVEAPPGENVPLKDVEAPTGENVPLKVVEAPPGEIPLNSVPLKDVEAPPGEIVPLKDVEAPTGENVPLKDVEAPAGEIVPLKDVEAPTGEIVPLKDVEAPSGEIPLNFVPLKDVEAPPGESPLNPIPLKDVEVLPGETVPQEDVEAPHGEAHVNLAPLNAAGLEIAEQLGLGSVFDDPSPSVSVDIENELDSVSVDHLLGILEERKLDPSKNQHEAPAGSLANGMSSVATDPTAFLDSFGNTFEVGEDDFDFNINNDAIADAYALGDNGLPLVDDVDHSRPKFLFEFAQSLDGLSDSDSDDSDYDSSVCGNGEEGGSSNFGVRCKAPDNKWVKQFKELLSQRHFQREEPVITTPNVQNVSSVLCYLSP